jgi:antitoxin component of MazEF toxin-antitoxin module
MQVAIAKWGHSAALRLPQSVLKQISRAIGDQLTMKVEGSKIILEPAGPSLEQLLAQITPENRHVEAFNDKAGNELL